MALAGISDCDYVFFQLISHFVWVDDVEFCFCFVGRAEEHVDYHINAAQVVIYVSFSWMDLIFVFEVGSWEHSSFD